MRIPRLGPIALIPFLLALAVPASQQEKPAQQPPAKPVPTPLVIPPEAAQRKNPIEASEESVALGKRLFVSQCALCHGAAGDGKGELAQEMQLKLKDFREAAQMKDRTDGALFYILTEGHAEMPAQQRLKEEQRWHLINFIRSLAKPAARDKPEAKPPGG